MNIDRISIEPSRFCTKGCSFCYNGSSKLGEVGFTSDEVVSLATDCAKHGVKYFSIGGGEPLEWPGIFDVLNRLRGVVARSFTTNGLPLLTDPTLLPRIVEAQPDKVHISIHAPENSREVVRVIDQVKQLDQLGVPAGVNLLVKRSRLAEAKEAASHLHGSGIQHDRIVFLPARGPGGETPSPKELANVARLDSVETRPFQSMSCLRGCEKSERFASIAADRTVAWCSYTVSRTPMNELTYRAIQQALKVTDLTPCADGLVKVRWVDRDSPSGFQLSD